MYTHMYISYVYDKCIIYTHNRVSFNLKEENPDICHCDNMDRPGSHYIKWNKPEKDKYLMISLICGVYKNKTNKTKQKHTHAYREQTGGCQRGGRWGGETGEGVITRYKPLDTK